MHTSKLTRPECTYAEVLQSVPSEHHCLITVAKTPCILSCAASLQDARLYPRTIPPCVPERMRIVTGVALPDSTWRVAIATSHVHAHKFISPSCIPCVCHESRAQFFDRRSGGGQRDGRRTGSNWRVRDDDHGRRRGTPSCMCRVCMSHALDSLDRVHRSAATLPMPLKGGDVLGRRSTAWSCTCRSSPTP